MSANGPDQTQTMQRVRVGMTGLATVMILIGLASAIFSTANREDPVNAIGAANPDVVANMTDTTTMNLITEQKTAEEPLAELGVAPSTGATETVNAMAIAEAVEANSTAPARLNR